MLSHEISVLTQKQLTSEVTIAEMNNQRVEAEIRQRHLEQQLSQEVHMFNQALLIGEVRSAFVVEDHERYLEYNEEIQRIQQRSEAYVGQQNEDIFLEPVLGARALRG